VKRLPGAGYGFFYRCLFRFAIGDYQSSNPERSANSIGFGFYLFASTCSALSSPFMDSLVQASDFSPALCHLPQRLLPFRYSRSGDAGHLANRDISFGSFRRMHGFVTEKWRELSPRRVISLRFILLLSAARRRRLFVRCDHCSHRFSNLLGI